LAEAEPQNPENHLRLSQIYRENRRFPEAHASLKKAAELDSDSLEVKYNLVLLLQQEGKNDEAIAAMKQLLADTAKGEYAPREKKNRALFLEQLGVLYRGAENYAEAQKAFRSMGEIDAESRPRALAHAIDTSRTARDYGKALEESKTAVDEFPDNLALASLRATVLAETGNTKEAAKVLKGLLKGNSEDREIYLALAQVHEKGKQYDKAIEAVEKAQSLSKTRAEQLGVLFAYGSVLERAKRFDEAEAKFTELLKLDPENASALNYFGYMLADLNKRLNDAHDMIQKALDLEPNNGAYLDSLGWVYYRQEKFDLAERYLLRSLEQFNRDPVVHSHLGDVYHKQGKVDQAQKHWKRSLEEWQRSAKSDQDQAEIMEVRKKLDSLALQLSSEAAGSKEIKE
jgi:tetratricopeptide (TPR) repeat protein